MIETDFMKFIRGHLVIKMYHPIPVPRHFSHQLCLFFTQDFFLQEAPGDFLVFRGRKSEPFDQDVPADIKESFKRSPQIRLGGGEVMPFSKKCSFVFEREFTQGADHFPNPCGPLGYDFRIDIGRSHSMRPGSFLAWLARRGEDPLPSS